MATILPTLEPFNAKNALLASTQSQARQSVPLALPSTTPRMAMPPVRLVNPVSMATQPEPRTARIALLASIHLILLRALAPTATPVAMPRWEGLLANSARLVATAILLPPSARTAQLASTLEGANHPARTVGQESTPRLKPPTARSVPQGSTLK